jgi:hypothetical protein
LRETIKNIIQFEETDPIFTYTCITFKFNIVKSRLWARKVGCVVEGCRYRYMLVPEVNLNICQDYKIMMNLTQQIIQSSNLPNPPSKKENQIIVGCIEVSQGIYVLQNV